jgi:hypothetical protein
MQLHKLLISAVFVLGVAAHAQTSRGTATESGTGRIRCRDCWGAGDPDRRRDRRPVLHGDERSGTVEDLGVNTVMFHATSNP